MLFRHQITLSFIGLSGLMLLLFSFYIYVVSANSRKQQFQSIIQGKALATKEIYLLHDKVAEKIITSFPEQSEYVFDENHRLIFAINDLHDFTFDKKFFDSFDDKPEQFFDYGANVRNGYKEGYGLRFGEDPKKRLVVIMAYNKSGFDQLESLKDNLIVGNLLFLGLTGITLYLLVTRAFIPIQSLVSESESVQAHDMNFRLSYTNPKNEIGIVANSFNKVLEKMQAMVQNQKSFISYASHELRTPLSAISGILETSLKYDLTLDQAKTSMEEAKKQIQKASTLVNGLLQLAKIESTDTLTERSIVNIVDVILDSISFFKLKFPQQEFSFQMIDAEINIEMGGNPELLRTALVNLIDNASKYSNRASIDLILAFKKPDLISICVIDQGIGIEGEDMPKIFDPLFRGRNVSTIEGFGLGLALTYRIVTHHHGQLKIYKNQGQGMTAEVLIPMMSEDQRRQEDRYY